MVLNPELIAKLKELEFKGILVNRTEWLTKLFLIEIGESVPKNVIKKLTFTKLIQITPKEPIKLLYPLFIEPNKAPKTTELTTRNVKSLVEKRVDEYRACFSYQGKGKRGLRPGSLGDRNDIIKKLSKWFKDTKFQYSFDDVITTAKVYVHSCQSDSYKYLQAADYFIIKDGRSRLSSYIDEFKDKPVQDQSDIEIYNELI